MAKRRTLLMRLLSWAANFTPNTVYFPTDLAVSLDREMAKIATEEGLDGCSLGSAVIAIAALAHKQVPTVGSTLTSTIHGLTHGGQDIGSFRIHVERISDEEAANG